LGLFFKKWVKLVSDAEDRDIIIIIIMFAHFELSDATEHQ